MKIKSNGAQGQGHSIPLKLFVSNQAFLVYPDLRFPPPFVWLECGLGDCRVSRRPSLLEAVPISYKNYPCVHQRRRFDPCVHRSTAAPLSPATQIMKTPKG